MKITLTKEKKKKFSEKQGFFKNVIAVVIMFWVATRLFGTSHRIGWEKDVQTIVTMDRKIIDLRANKI